MLEGEGLERRDMQVIPRRAEMDEVPLSFAQQRLWLLDKLVPGNPFYCCDSSMPIHARVDIEALRDAVNEVASRHDQLRVSFREENGEPRQIIATEVDIPVRHIDLSYRLVGGRQQEAIRLATLEAQRPFDLSKGPLMRVMLISLDAMNHILVITMHHIVSDGWSLGILSREMQAFYTAFASRQKLKLALPEIEYADFAVWQREWLSGPRLEEQLNYWLKRLKDLPPLELPTDYKRPVMPSFQGDFV